MLIVFHRALRRGSSVLADVDPEDAAPARARNVLQEGVDPDVVEAEPIDERLAVRKAKEPRSCVSRLRPRGHGADFDEAKAQACESVDVRRVLVEPRGEAHGIGKLQTHDTSWSGRNGRIG